MTSGILRLLLVVLLAPLLAVGARPVKLGLVAPPGEPDGTSLLRGVQLAVAEANENTDAPVALEVRGESGQWGTVGNDAVTLVCERHVDGIISPSDGAAVHLILQVSGRTRVPVASLCPDASVTEAGVFWAVRVVARTDQEAAALFRAVCRTDGQSARWCAVVPSGHPGRAVRRDLETAARLTGSRLEGVIEDDAAHDVVAVTRTLVATSPDGILLWTPPARAGAMAAALRQAGFAGRLAGPGRLDSAEFLRMAGAAAENLLVAGVCAPGMAFAERYQRKFGAAPDSTAAAAHDAARVLIDTLRRSDAGAGYRQFPLAGATEGATGILHFDEGGNRADPVQILTCRRGHFVPVTSTDPHP